MKKHLADTVAINRINAILEKVTPSAAQRILGFVSAAAVERVQEEQLHRMSKHFAGYPASIRGQLAGEAEAPTPTNGAAFPS